MSQHIVNSDILVRSLKINRDNWNARSERIIPTQLLQLTDLLHELFFDERNVLLQKRNDDFKPALKNINEILEFKEPEVSLRCYAEINKELSAVSNLIALSPDSTYQLSKYFSKTDGESSADAIMLDFEDALSPTLSSIVAAYSNLSDIVSGHVRFIPRSGQLHGSAVEKNKQPYLIVRVRAMHQSERMLLFGNAYAIASLCDLVFAIHNQVKYLLPQNKDLVIMIPKCYDYNEANWWHRVICELEDIYSLETGSIKVVLEVCSLRNCVQLNHMIHALECRLVGLYANLRCKFFDDLRHRIKRTGEILPARSKGGIDSEAFMHFLGHIRNAAARNNILSLAGLGLNDMGTLYTACEDSEVAAYHKHLDEISKFSFDIVQISNPYYARFISPSVNEFNQPASINDMLNYDDSKISLSDLRDNLRAAIEFMHAWDQGIGNAFFDNRYEDIISFDIIRAQVRQWITNQVTTTEGEQINTRLVTMMLIEESEKLKQQLEEEFDGNPTAEMRTILNTYTQATIKLEQLLLKDDVPGFFTSDPVT